MVSLIHRSLKPFIGAAFGMGGAYLFHQTYGPEAAIVFVGALAGYAVGHSDMGGEAHDKLVELLGNDGLFDREVERDSRKRGLDDNHPDYDP
jgi:hypothetical protein